jgi:hypothetical protein
MIRESLFDSMVSLRAGGRGAPHLSLGCTSRADRRISRRQLARRKSATGIRRFEAALARAV